MKMTPYLGFDGNCREAFSFYAELLDARIEAMVSHGESPIRDEVPADWHERIIHACLVSDNAMLMGGDAPPGRYEPPRGVMVAIEIKDVMKAQQVFDAFANGGEIEMPFEETFWVEKFGMVRDRFGTQWAVNGGKEKSF